MKGKNFASLSKSKVLFLYQKMAFGYFPQYWVVAYWFSPSIWPSQDQVHFTVLIIELLSVEVLWFFRVYPDFHFKVLVLLYTLINTMAQRHLKLSCYLTNIILSKVQDTRLQDVFQMLNFLKGKNNEGKCINIKKDSNY